MLLTSQDAYKALRRLEGFAKGLSGRYEPSERERREIFGVDAGASGQTIDAIRDELRGKAWPNRRAGRVRKLTATTPDGTYTRRTARLYTHVVVYDQGRGSRTTWHSSLTLATRRAAGLDPRLVTIHPVDPEVTQ